MNIHHGGRITGYIAGWYWVSWDIINQYINHGFPPWLSHTLTIPNGTSVLENGYELTMFYTSDGGRILVIVRDTFIIDYTMGLILLPSLVVKIL